MRGPGLAAALAMASLGCGRVEFETVDASAADAGALDAGADAALPDAPAPDASCLAAGADPCTSLPRLAEPPAIDGTLEPCLALLPIEPAGWTEPAMAIPVVARAAVAWRPDGLYAYVEVDDDALFPARPGAERAYCGDGVEIHVDDDGVYARAPDYDDPGTAQLIVAAPASGADIGTFGERYVFPRDRQMWTDPRFSMHRRAGGYALEIFVGAGDLGRGTWTLEAGSRVGLDLAVNVSSADGTSTGDPLDCGARLGQFFLRTVPAGAACGLPHCDVAAFCTPTLAP